MRSKKSSDYKNNWLNKNCALVISKGGKYPDDYNLWLVVYEPSFGKVKADIKVVKIKEEITQIEEEWEGIIEEFKTSLEKSEHPSAKIYNNAYTAELPLLIQDYKNVEKRKIKLSPQTNPDDYIRPYDIIWRKIGGVPAHHAAIYLGNKQAVHISAYNPLIDKLKEYEKKIKDKTVVRESHETDEWLKKQVVQLKQETQREKNINITEMERNDTKAQITPWEYFLKGAEEIEIHHPFIPFKKPELIQKHINTAVKSEYGLGKYHLSKDNCEHFATLCVYGLGMSQQTKSKIGNAEYLLRAIKESNQLFEEMENDLIAQGKLKSDEDNHSEIQAEASGSRSNNNQWNDEIIEINDSQEEYELNELNASIEQKI